MDDHGAHLKERFAVFARAYIAGRDLNTPVFPQDLWEKMAEHGLFDLGTRERLLGNYLAIGMAAETLVGEGGSMGLALSWLMHELVALFFIMGFGSPSQQRWYADLAAGKMTICLAVSEPGKGAHPKFLETRAVREGDRFILNGEKAYLTNGPIADLFIVIAVTGEENGRKRFTAFLVPKDSPGVTVTSMEMPFLRPAPHGGLRLENCPAADILGREGQAYEDLVLPFREVEDALMTGPVVGAMARQLGMLIPLLRERGDGGATVETLGNLAALINVEQLLAYETMRMLDRDVRGPEFVSQLIVFRSLAREFLARSEELVPQEAGTAALASLRNDFRQAVQLAANVLRVKQKKLGESLFP